MQTISAARAALICATFPLQTMFVAALLRHERLALTKSLGVLLTIVGVGLALGDKAFSVASTQRWTVRSSACLVPLLMCAVACAIDHPPDRDLADVVMKASGKVTS